LRIFITLINNKENVIEENTRERLTGAFIRVFDIKQGRLVDIVMTDEKGR